MQSILNQAKNDPAALQNHMQNATIRTKIQKVSIPKNLACRGRILILTIADCGGCDPTWAVMKTRPLDIQSQVLVRAGIIWVISVFPFPCI
jgi:hypothetical protein